MRTQRKQDTLQTTAPTEARTGKRKSKPSKPERSLAGDVLSGISRGLDPDALWLQLQEKAQRDVVEARQTLIAELSAHWDAWAHQNVKAQQDFAARISDWAAAYVQQRPLPLLLLGPAAKEGESGALAGEKHDVTAADIDAVLENLDQGIAAEQVAMDRLLERMASRTPR